MNQRFALFAKLSLIILISCAPLKAQDNQPMAMKIQIDPHPRR
jgi:hypothetical protein